MPKFDPQHGLNTIAIQAEEAENPNPGFLYLFAVMIAVESTTPFCQQFAHPVHTDWQ